MIKTVLSNIIQLSSAKVYHPIDYAKNFLLNSVKAF